MTKILLIIGLAMMAAGLAALNADTFQQAMTGLVVCITGVAVVINTGPLARALRRL